jgi:hypothetical protein
MALGQVEPDALEQGLPLFVPRRAVLAKQTALDAAQSYLGILVCAGYALIACDPARTAGSLLNRLRLARTSIQRPHA